MDFNSKKLDLLLANTGDMALKRRARKIVEGINPLKGDRILEVGCGDGFYLHLISNLNIENLILYGVDFDKNALKSAKKNLRGKKVKLLYADLMQKLPFKSGMFDKIIMSEVAEHLPNDLKGFSEVKRVLKKGGTLLVTVPNQNYPFLWDPVNWIAERLFKTHIRSGFWAGLWNQHLRLYKPDDIKKIIKKAGYKVGEVSSLTWWCLPFNHYLVNLTARAIHSGKLDPDIKALVNKYEMKIKRPLLLDLAFFVAQTVDMLNDIFPVKKSGVGVFVSAEKP